MVARFSDDDDERRWRAKEEEESGFVRWVGWRVLDGEECVEDFGDGERSVFVTDDESERFGEWAGFLRESEWSVSVRCEPLKRVIVRKIFTESEWESWKGFCFFCWMFVGSGEIVGVSGVWWVFAEWFVWAESRDVW